MCKGFLLMEMGGYWDFICNTAACKRMSLLQDPGLFPREQSAEAEVLLCEARLRS